MPAAALEEIPVGIAPGRGLVPRANYLTSRASERATLRAGEHLLVLGAAGGVGIAAVQLGKICLGARVIAAASTEKNEILLTVFGADATVDYTQIPTGATGSRH